MDLNDNRMRSIRLRTVSGSTPCFGFFGIESLAMFPLAYHPSRIRQSKPPCPQGCFRRSSKSGGITNMFESREGRSLWYTSFDGMV
jgi:hypothetical protein